MPERIRVGVLTISDSAVLGTRQDLSGPAVRGRCEELGWTVANTATVPDEVEVIARQLCEWADDNIGVIFSTGGTGIAPRDVTPEATRSVLEREIPGLAEQMRAQGSAQTKFAVLSRGVVGTRGRTLVVNLPGSPAGAVYSLQVIESLIPHIVELLNGNTEHSSG